MVNVILGKKLEMASAFDEKGRRVPLTFIEAGPCPVIQVKVVEKDGYAAVHLGFGQKKKANKPLLGHIKKSGLKNPPRYLREAKLESGEGVLKVGDIVKVGDVVASGDIVTISGTSKGKGFTGVVKKWGFAGGPRTHGQSDRQRAPGSIGQTTTPGRVFKGKKMAGRSGGGQVTVKNLEVFEVSPEENLIKVKGSVPGARNSLLIIKRTKRVKEVDKKVGEVPPTPEGSEDKKENG